MGWTFTYVLERFDAEAGHFLRARPVENSVPLTVGDALRRSGRDAYGDEAPYFGWWRPDHGGAVEAAFVRTPPHPPLLTRAPERAARELAESWHGPLPGATGDRASVLAFAGAWRARTGEPARIRREMRLYRLAELTPRTPVPPGAARVAGQADRDLLLRWTRGYAEDVGDLPIGGERALDEALARGGRTLWESPAGEPLAMAGATTPVEGAVRILSVYTPPQHRGHGYAGAVTAAISRAALDAGATAVLLVADLANPVSTGLYRRLGYRPVSDHVSLDFRAPPAYPV